MPQCFKRAVVVLHVAFPARRDCRFSSPSSGGGKTSDRRSCRVARRRSAVPARRDQDVHGLDANGEESSTVNSMTRVELLEERMHRACAARFHVRESLLDGQALWRNTSKKSRACLHYDTSRINLRADVISIASERQIPLHQPRRIGVCRDGARSMRRSHARLTPWRYCGSSKRNRPCNLTFASVR
jgi:hypothetical protein